MPRKKTKKEKLKAFQMGIGAFMEIGHNFHVVATLDIEKPETIAAMQTFGEALLDAYNRGYADAQARNKS